MAPSSFPQRKIGDDSVSALGLGCMGMSWAYTSFGGYDDAESMRVLSQAADSGVKFWDTADGYGSGKNEELIGRWFQETGRRSEIFLATKFATYIDPESGKLRFRGDREYVFQACEASLKRLGVDHIDLYYQHRVDLTVPVEETVTAMAELKQQGKIRYLGLSECSAATLRRAHKVHPIAAVQMEYSPFALEIESEQTKLLETARELGVKVVAYSPLGRGFLTGAVKSRADLDPTDIRFGNPRFSEENFGDNLKLVETLAEMARKKGATPGQLSIAWLMAQGDDIIPIPGTKRVKFLEENIKAASLSLTQEEVAAIRSEIEKVGGSKGSRYPPAMMTWVFADSPELKA